MAYIGNVPAEKYIDLIQQTFSSPTGTSFTLSQAVTNSVDIDLYIDNVKQDPTTYSASGTSLTTSTISSPSTMYCIYNGRAMQTVSVPDDSVGLGQMASGTDGNLITFDASGNPAYVATGSSGQVLTSAGAGAAPSFAAAQVFTEGASAKPSGNQTITASTTTKIQLATENYDTGSNFDSSTNYEYVVPTTGRYFVASSLRLAINEAAHVEVIIGKNGSGGSTLPLYMAQTATTSTVAVGIAGCGVYDLTASDTLSQYIWHNSSGTEDVTAANTFMNVWKVETA